MEKNKNRTELEDDDEEKFIDGKKSKSSKSESKSKTDESPEPNREASEKKQEKRGLASFFTDKSPTETEKPEKTENEKDDDQEPNLSEEEVHEATLVIVDSLTQEVAEELNSVEPDSVDEFEALADAVFLEELLDIAEGDGDITQESINQAYAETLADLSLEDEPVLDTRNETDSILETTNLDADEDNNTGTINAQIPNSTTPNTPITPTRPPIISNFPTPPIPPISNFNNGPQPPIPPPPNNMNTINNLNVPTSAVSNPNTAVETVEIIHGRRSDMLVGAIIGYIVGRRGGRKRTEKKLQPKINNLEEQVTELHSSIVEKELKIRKLARLNMELSSSASKQTVKVIERRKTKKEVKETLKRREQLASDPGVEKIGKFSLPALKVFHERRLPDGSENNPKRKQVELMTETELVEKVAGLKIEGLVVVDMYYRKRLSIESLRKITKEYLRSGPFRQTFTQELLPDEQELHQKRTQVHTAQSKSTENAKFSENKDSNVSIDIEKANKLADALMMTQKQTTAPSSNKRHIISGVLTGIIVASILFVLLLVN